MRALAQSTAFLLSVLGAFCSHAQETRPDFQGMWSDPPATPEDYFCYFYCTDAGIEYLTKLLDDPANDARAYSELEAEASSYQLQEVIRPNLTAAALERLPRDPADDPGFLYCEPWGLFRQMFAPHQLEIRQHEDRIEMRYGEWEARRTIYLDGRAPPESSSAMGFSLGRYEGESLVVETTQVRANLAGWSGEHSAQLSTVEVYTRSADGKRLLLAATLEDPWGFIEPLHLKKVWSWAPDEEIYPYDDCEPAAESSPEGADR